MRAPCGQKIREDHYATLHVPVRLYFESWAAQIKNPQNRMDTVGTALCEAAGGKLIGAWLCFGDYDAVVIADMPNMESTVVTELVLLANLLFFAAI